MRRLFDCLIYLIVALDLCERSMYNHRRHLIILRQRNQKEAREMSTLRTLKLRAVEQAHLFQRFPIILFSLIWLLFFSCTTLITRTFSLTIVFITEVIRGTSSLAHVSYHFCSSAYVSFFFFFSITYVIRHLTLSFT